MVWLQDVRIVGIVIYFGVFNGDCELVVCIRWINMEMFTDEVK